MTVPVTVDRVYLGDTGLTIDAGDGIAIPAGRMVQLLAPLLSPNAKAALARALAARPSIGLDAFSAEGIVMRYDPHRIELAVSIPPHLRATKTLQIAELSRPHFGEYEQPARLSAYLNIRSSLDHLEQAQSSEFLPPIIALDGAARFHGLVLESEGSWRPGSGAPDAQREGTRLVFDDRDDLVRWTLGDLLPITRGFQATPEMAGISVFRSYSVLQPEMVARPTGVRSFRLTRPSTVEIWVDGRLVRRLFLDAGSYDLRDFPFTQQVDDVRVVIQEDTGRVETLRFNLFSDQAQLAPGLSEFGLYTGVAAPLGPAGPAYSHEGILTGFYRRGLTEGWTLGANFQADARGSMGGIESILAGPFGALDINLAASAARAGPGLASVVTFERMAQHSGGRWDSWNLSAEAWSDRFTPVGAPGQSLTAAGPVTTTPAGTWSPGASASAAAQLNIPQRPTPTNPYVYQLGAGYSHAFDSTVDLGIDLHYAHARPPCAGAQLYRLLLGWHPTGDIDLSAESDYQNRTTALPGGIVFLLSVTVRLDSFTSITADEDGRDRLSRAAFQVVQGSGAGSLDLAGDAQYADGQSSLDASADYLGSAGEIGLEHVASFGGGSGLAQPSRTSLRLGTSLAFADGAVSLGRPIYDSFAIVTRHKNLDGTEVVLDPMPNGSMAHTTLFGTATEPDLGSYIERTIRIDAPDAAPEVDLGKGAFRLLPPYRSGYRLQAGSDYSVTAVGRLLDGDGNPLALVAGTATEMTGGKAPYSTDIFTNRNGRFGVAGLRPGRWRIEMHADSPIRYEIQIRAGSGGIARLGDLIPLASRHGART